MQLNILACQGCADGMMALNRPLAVFAPLVIVPWAIGVAFLRWRAAKCSSSSNDPGWIPCGNTFWRSLWWTILGAPVLGMFLFPWTTSLLVEFLWGIGFMVGLVTGLTWLSALKSHRIAQAYVAINIAALLGLIAVEFASARYADTTKHLALGIGQLPYAHVYTSPIARLISRGDDAVPELVQNFEAACREPTPAAHRVGSLAYCLSRIGGEDVKKVFRKTIEDAQQRHLGLYYPEWLAAVTLALADLSDADAEPILVELFENATGEQEVVKQASAQIGLLRIGSPRADDFVRTNPVELTEQFIRLRECRDKLLESEQQERRRMAVYQRLTRSVDEEQINAELSRIVRR